MEFHSFYYSKKQKPDTQKVLDSHAKYKIMVLLSVVPLVAVFVISSHLVHGRLHLFSAN